MKRGSTRHAATPSTPAPAKGRSCTHDSLLLSAPDASMHLHTASRNELSMQCSSESAVLTCWHSETLCAALDLRALRRTGCSKKAQRSAEIRRAGAASAPCCTCCIQSACTSSVLLQWEWCLLYPERSAPALLSVHEARGKTEPAAPSEEWSICP
jgi:hypothetical protein